MSQSIDAYKTTYQCSKQPVTRIKELNFGMGYRQILEDGLNSDTETWNMDFVPLDTTDATSLEVILSNSVKISSDFISWIPNGETTAKYWTAHDIQKQPAGPGWWKITCVFRREFILG
jgi:phage-related protein